MASDIGHSQSVGCFRIRSFVYCGIVVYLLGLNHLNYHGVMMYGCEHLRPQRQMLLLALR
jgi:hypothetical protein